MRLNSSRKNKLLKNMVLIIPVFLIAFFIASSVVDAAKFKYSEFDFEEFAKENYGYWTKECAENPESEEDEEECEEKTLKAQEKFYTRLYKLLAKYESKGYFIDDTTIITTVFYELDPVTFADNSEAYKQENSSEDKNAYNEDEDDLSEYDIDATTENGQTAAEYFEQENDTLKLLLKSMIGYKNYCYGLYNKTTTTNDDGEEETTCSKGILTTINDETYCANFISSNPSGFWDHIMKASKVKTFFGIKSDKQEECEESDDGTYDNGVLFYTEKEKTVNEELFWEFLEISNYFDRKVHLQNKFNIILNKVEKKNMSELTEEEYEEYDKEIKKVRKGIIADIKNILKDFRGETDDPSLEAANQTLFWWPIGSAETTTNDGKLYATDDPVTVNITSPYGMRNGKMHKGIDIADGSAPGTDYIIAAQSGIVTEVVNGCEEGDTECGGGYGNYIIINHNDGSYYTVYAHLHNNSIKVAEGDSVEKGQVIGSMGNSGNSTGTHLHFEVRTGADSSYAVDPLDYVDPNNPRQNAAGGPIAEFISSFEGTGPIEGDNYKVYCNSGDIPTVGHGITLKFNKPLFEKYGLNADNYTCGSLIPINIVDQIYYDRLEQDRQSIVSSLSSNNINNLKDYQIDALLSLKYNCGNIEGFSSAYSSYGSTESLCNNWWHNKAIKAGSDFENGLRKRRQKECKLFLTGVYDGNN